MSDPPARGQSDAAPRVVTVWLLVLTAVHMGSRLLFLTSSSNMASDSASYILNVREFLETGLRLRPIEMGHPLYVVWCGWVGSLVTWISPGADPAFCCKLAGILISAASVAPFYWLGRWLLRGTVNGLVATGIYCFIPISWWWSGEIMSDATNTAALVIVAGCFARWVEGRSVVYLAAGLFFFGASLAIRIASVTLAPLFAVVILLGMARTRRWSHAWTAALAPLPILLLIAADQAAHPERSIGYYFIRSALHGSVDLGLLITGARWQGYWQHLVHALGVVGVTLAAVGLVHALVRRRAVAAFTMLWSASALIVQVIIPVIPPQIRMLLPVAPMAALLMTEALTLIPRRPRPIAFLASAAITAACLAWHAFPDLHALHTRVNVLDAVAKWHAEYTEPNSLLVAGSEERHINLHAPDRKALFYHHFVDEGRSWWGTAVGTRELVLTVDRALAEGRPVYGTNLQDPIESRNLRRFYDHRLVHRIAGDRLRNFHDVAFAFMGERMRMEVDLEFYRLERRRDPSVPRAAPPPIARRARNDRGQTFITLRVVDPSRPDRLAVPLLMGRAGAIEPTSARFGEDDVLKACADSFVPAAAKLDRGGRAILRVRVSPEVASRPLHAAYALINEGCLEAISVAAPVAAGAAGP